MLLARNRACDRAQDSHDSVRSVRALCMRPTYDNALHRAPFGPLFMGIVKKKKEYKKDPRDLGRHTFSPVSMKDSFKTIMALVAHFDLELHQKDVKTAFLNGNIDETI